MGYWLYCTLLSSWYMILVTLLNAQYFEIIH